MNVFLIDAIAAYFTKPLWTTDLFWLHAKAVRARA